MVCGPDGIMSGEMAGLVALTRGVSAAMAECELTHVPRLPIDLARAAEQHAAYELALERLGCTVHRLPAPDDMPDAVFIEDTAVVLDEIAIVTRPGAPSRRPETSAVEEWLKHRLLLSRIDAPGTMDGGDVLAVGRQIFVGATSRTNAEAIDQFRRIVEYFGYTMTVVDVRGCLHLKSAVTALSDDTLLVNRLWISEAAFEGYELVDVHPDERAAANIVRVGDRLLYSAAFPRTLERLKTRGAPVTAVDVSELAKAEGAVTCCSLIMKPLET
jgi:dimethylargininase